MSSGFKVYSGVTSLHHRVTWQLICECELTSWILNEQKRIEPRANPPDSSRKSIFCCSNLDQKTVMKFYILVAVRRYDKHYSRTVPYHQGVLVSIWCFSYPLWHLDFCIRRMRVWMGRGVKSQVSCTSSRFQTPPAPSIPSLSPSLTAAFHSSTVLNQRFLYADGTIYRLHGHSSGLSGRPERKVREIWILTRLIKYILYRLRCEPADVLSS